MNTNKIKLSVLLLMVSIAFSCCNNTVADKENNTVTQQPPSANKHDNSNAKAKIELKIYQNDSSIKGWGYDVYMNNALYIHQPNIPAVPGNRGFQSEQNAKTAGNLAVYKIRNNIMPPTITPEELDSLGVKY